MAECGGHDSLTNWSGAFFFEPTGPGDTMKYRASISILAFIVTIQIVSACKPASVGSKEIDRGVLWVRSSAEFEALTLQAYRAASDDLHKFVDDTSWSALPGQQSAAELPPAIIADVDETIVSNVEFQVYLEPPFTNKKMDDWNNSSKAEPIPGAVGFIHEAQEAGVEVFFVTNRPCEQTAGIEDPCPQKSVTLQDLREVGIAVDGDHLMLSGERPGWDREKLTRREFIAQTHRVIMLFGDDLGDFIACSRKKPLIPCTEGATVASRHAATLEMTQYWGEGWYVLPNPMHGSWTTVK